MSDNETEEVERVATEESIPQKSKNKKDKKKKRSEYES